MVIITKFNYKPSVGHSFVGVKSITDKRGYIPNSKRIENMMIEGKKLRAFRDGQFMYNASSFDNLSALDSVVAQIPHYLDEMQLFEQQAFYAGARKAFAERMARDSVSKADDKRIAELRSSFETFVKSFAVQEKATETEVNKEKASEL